MNRYLLLRDNKQSGPYTVSEIIAKGIKPYDLVWLDGKSAAWRYPSEVEELKAYAPTVEEQPYDRFYKKAETPPVAKPAERRTAFEPAVTSDLIRKKIDTGSKKVYINFPGSTAKVVTYRPPAPETAVQPAEPVSIRKESQPVAEPLHTAPADRKLLYAATTACLLLVALISFLLVYYNNQKKNIRQLTEKVQLMEQRQNEAVAAAARYTTFPKSASAAIEETPAGQLDQSKASAGQPAEPPAVKPAPAQRSVAKIMTPAIKAFEKKDSPTKAVDIAPAQTPPAAAPPVRAAVKEDLYRLVSVRPGKFKTGLLGGISNLQLELENNSSTALKQVAVEVNFLNPEKKVVKTQTVYFDKVSPGSKPMVDVPKSNRGIAVVCRIVDIKS